MTRGGTERVEVFRGKDRLWYWRVVGANNEPEGHSEGHQNRADVMKIATDLFPDHGLWVEDNGTWKEGAMSANEQEGQTTTEGTEDGEPLLDPQPEPENEPGVEDGPEPTEDWSEDEEGDEG